VTGELVRRELGKIGDAHDLPRAYRFDVYPKGMDKDRAALERAWPPFLDGKATCEEGPRNLVRDATRQEKTAEGAKRAEIFLQKILSAVFAISAVFSSYF